MLCYIFRYTLYAKLVVTKVYKIFYLCAKITNVKGPQVFATATRLILDN